MKYSEKATKNTGGFFVSCIQRFSCFKGMKIRDMADAHDGKKLSFNFVISMLTIKFD
jgi:hypothetical protein